jgi:hypothetical protein
MYIEYTVIGAKVTTLSGRCKVDVKVCGTGSWLTVLSCSEYHVRRNVYVLR